jgi:hypothetical protein
MSKFDQKRESLHKFIEEQVIGPGATGFRYIDISDEENLNEDVRPKDRYQEIIGGAPGILYSSGILFPINHSDSAQNEDQDSQAQNDEPTDEDTGANSNKDDDDPEEVLNIDQMFPNSMGITCCLREEAVGGNDVKIRVRARHYERLRSEYIRHNVALYLDQDASDFNHFIEEIGQNSTLYSKVKVQKASDILKNAEEEAYLVFLSNTSSEETGSIRKELRDFNVDKANELGSNRDNQALSGYKQFLFSQIRRKEAVKDDLLDRYYSIIEKIEAAENFISHINDLLSFYDGRGFGLWKSKHIDKEITLPEPIPSSINGKVIYSYNFYRNSLKNLFSQEVETPNNKYPAWASLSINFQISRDTKGHNEGVFLKAQLVNTSTPFRGGIDDQGGRYYSVFNELVNQRAFFGVEIEVESQHLKPYKDLMIDCDKDEGEYKEDEVDRFLYRQFEDYGIGHGCSINWDIGEKKKTVRSEYIPSHNTPDVEPIPKDKDKVVEIEDRYEPDEVLKGESGKCLQFKWLSDLSDTEDQDIVAELYQFVNKYEEWIEKAKARYQDDRYRGIAKQQLNECSRDKERMRSNIEQLLEGESNNSRMHSFRLMNTVMFIQLWHSIKGGSKEIRDTIGNSDFQGFDKAFYKERSDGLFDENTPVSWRPFQLAFILLNLDGIFQRSDDPYWYYRNELVDLVWFPTGGGKTEAYLGIIALTVINRRKNYGPDGGGTAVIMRYSLRLLTLQQFQRATLLIMALELVRRIGGDELGEEPIYIGLWVGSGSAPNYLEYLEKEHENLSNSIQNGTKDYSKVPFDSCPWCNSQLAPSTHTNPGTSGSFMQNRLDLRCSNTNCAFYSEEPVRDRPDQGAIPVSLCDEEVYQHPPTLLFGTVDKFAQLAHRVSERERNKDSRRLFGRGNWERGKPDNGYLTPDLIIQDELHLLQGPLGSSTALYESAIDQLATREENGSPIRPKVISSTATTKNTALQIMALFDREVNIFPKSGPTCDDSFFAVYKRSYSDPEGEQVTYKSKKRYLGILPTGRTQIWMQMRLIALMMTHRALFEKDYLNKKNLTPFSSDLDDEVRKVMDYYHTAVTYFNSVREVGKTESQVHTYIIKEIRKVFNRVLRPGKAMHGLYTYGMQEGELTGRLSGEEVKKELESVTDEWEPQKRFAHTDEHGSPAPSKKTPPDLVVATNMISVGIDVSRFNNLIVNSMPRNLAEYIQVTGRIAREKKGLVFTVHHPFRARDVSHYEKFIEFHEKMYSHVEPISITPFTKKAIERYLRLYVAVMVRHFYYPNRNSASEIVNLTEESYQEIINSLVKYFRDRKERLQNNHNVPETIKKLLQEEDIFVIETWIKEALDDWYQRAQEFSGNSSTLVFNNKVDKANPPQEQLYVDIDEYEQNIHSKKWQIPLSLRVVDPEAAIDIKSK